MRRFLASVVAAFALLAPVAASAVTVPMDRPSAGTVTPLFILDAIKANQFIATSTSLASIFTYASTTMITWTATSSGSKGINLTGGCFAINNTCLTAGGSSASSTLLGDNNTFSGNNRFTASTTFSALLNISNSTTTFATITNSLWFQSITSSLLSTDANGKVAATTTPTATNYIATSNSIASLFPFASTTAVSGANSYFTNSTSTTVNGTTGNFGTLSSTGNTTLTNATSTNFFATTASSTNLFSTSAAFRTLSTTGLTSLANASSTSFTTTGNVWFTALGVPAGTILAVDPNGKLIATTSSPGGVTAVNGTYPIISSGGATPALSIAFGTTTANTWSLLQTFSNSSTTLTTISNSLWLTGVNSSLLSTDANGKVVATSTPTATNFIATSASVASIFPAASTTAISGTNSYFTTSTSTTANATTMNAGTLTVTGNTTLANATSTNFFATTASSTNLFAQSASVGTLTVSTTGTTTFNGGLTATRFNWTATSTGSNGINISGGCFAINNTCIGGSSSGTVNSGTTGYTAYYAADGTAVSATSSLFFAANNRIGIGTTSPMARFSIHANAADTNLTLFAIASSTNNSTTTLFTIANNGLMTGLDYSLRNGTSTNFFATTASSTNLFAQGAIFGTLSVTTTGTTTFNGGISASRLNWTATSSGSQGINLSGGCFAVNGNCITNGAGATPGGSDTYVQFNDGGSTFNGTSGLVFQKGMAKLGIGTSTPWGQLSIASSTYNCPSGICPLMVVATSSDELFTIYASSTIPNSIIPSLASGVHAVIGKLLNVAQSLFINGSYASSWQNNFCDNFTMMGATNIAADTHFVCGFLTFDEGTNATLGQNSSIDATVDQYGATLALASGTSNDGVVLAGGGMFPGNFGTSTPGMEVLITAGSPFSTTTSLYVGVTSAAVDGNAANNPSMGCYWAATSTTNWQIVANSGSVSIGVQL